MSAAPWFGREAGQRRAVQPKNTRLEHNAQLSPDKELGRLNRPG